MSDYIYPNNSPIALLDCKDAFNELTEKEKLYAHYLSMACWYGSLIVSIQTSPESPLIFTLLQKLFRVQPVSDLKQVALNECNFTEDEFTAFLIYTCAIFSNKGNYKAMGDTKFIPNLPEEKFKKLILTSKLYKEQPADVDRLLSKCKDSIYLLKDGVYRLGFPPQGITTYFSKNVTKEDESIVRNFMKEKNLEAWNTRLFKEKDGTGNTCYEIRHASILQTADSEGNKFVNTHTLNSHKFSVSRGDYSPILEIVNKYLEIAKQYAQNQNEEKMIENYVRSFRTGSIDAHKDGSRYWIKDKGPVIESYIGFIENYRDPAGMRSEFEGFVALVNKKTSAKFGNLVGSAEKFLKLLPWTSAFEKDKFMRPDFTSLDVLCFAASDLPAGICIPNYHEMREKDGFKNVSLGNVINVKPTTRPNYLSHDDQDVLIENNHLSFEVQVGLHELLGHGSGKMLRRDKDGSFNFDAENTVDFVTKEKVTSWYEDGETYDSVFGSLGCAYEECRAECVALHLSDNPDVLKIFGFEGEKAETIIYCGWLSMALCGIESLQMYNTKTEAWLQAHARARFVILNVLLEAGEDFVKLERIIGADLNPDLLLTLDRTKIRSVGKPAIATFLGKLQLFRSTANIAAAKELFNKYSLVSSEGKHPFLDYKDIVMARKKPRKFFVQANTFIEGGKVQLRTYKPDTEGMVQSWIDCFQEINVDAILEDLWEKDKPHFS